ncbi:MAG: helix-turn-helix domain-containing protein [Cellulomonas sp.]
MRPTRSNPTASRPSAAVDKSRRRRESWPPPRGIRDELTGRWLWSLPARPATSFSCADEARAVTAYRDLVNGLIDTRLNREWSLRKTATQAGLSLTAVTALEQGSSWPTLTTVETLANALALDVRVRPGPNDPVDPQPVVPAVIARIAASGLSKRRAAYAAELRPNTVTDLTTITSPSLLTVLALARVAGAQLVTTPR